MSKITTLAQVLADAKEPTAPSGIQLLNSKRCQTPQHDINSQELAQLLASVPAEQLSNNQDQRLRWLAFYYLSKRELSQQALRQKLLAKDQDPNKVEALLTEFAHKGYQSDERCAYMLIREAIRRGRGKQHIAHNLSQHGIDLPYSLDELIARTDTDSLCDGTILDDTNNKDNIDWLRLAVEARSKKYGNALPTTPKDKARQLRFLQYRGFEMAICFDALKTTLDELD